MALTVSAHTYGPAAQEALAAAVERCKSVRGSFDPLTPVTIVAPSSAARYHIRHTLGQRSGGLVNAQIKLLGELLDLIGATAMANAGRRPLPDVYRTELIRAVAEQGRQIFGDVPIEGALLRTLERRFAEFDACDRDQLQPLQSHSDVSAYLLALYDEYLVQTRNFYTRRDLAGSATAALAQRPVVLRDIGAVIVYLPSELNTSQRAFLDELSRQTDVEVLLGLTGDVEAIDRRTLSTWGLELDLATPLPAAPTAQRIIQAPDAEEEVRAAIREIAQALLADQPTPLHRTAILYRQPEPYARICAEQLDAAGIVWNGQQSTTLRQSIAGRTLDGLIDLMSVATVSATSRPLTWVDDVAPWLSAAPILDTQGRDAPTARWNQLARRANLQHGPQDWLLRLGRYRATVAADLERLTRGADEQRPGRLRWVQSELNQVDDLVAFAEWLSAFTRETPPTAEWSAYVQLARRGLERLLGGRSRLAALTSSSQVAQRDGEADLELTRWDDVQRLLGELAGLDELKRVEREASSIERFSAAVRRGLERAHGHRGRVGAGVFTGMLSLAVGMQWDIVYIVGAAERSLPPIRREDPLLSDALRDRASLPSASDALRRERSQYLAALHAAEHRVLSYPRADLRAQRACLPGRWLLESATALNGGQRVYASRFDQVSGDVIDAIPSFEGALLSTPMPADVQEYDLQSVRRSGHPLRHYLADTIPSVGRAARRQIERWSPVLTHWDGLLAAPSADHGVEALNHSEAWSDGEQLIRRPHSAGALQDWATCPYRYFLGRVLQVEERDELRDDLQITPLDKGTLIHDILNDFFRETPRQPQPAEVWSDDDRKRLRSLAESRLEAAREQGLTGRALLWRRDRNRILEDLETLLKRDDQHRADLGVQQVASELVFGDLPDSSGMVDFRLADGRLLRLRGVIDRVDRPDDTAPDASGPRAVVIDYKTGSELPKRAALAADPLVGGRFLQLPIYAHATRRLFGLDADAPIDSAYWFITRRGNFQFNAVPWHEVNQSRFEQAIHLIAEHIQAGRFPANPGKPHRSALGEHCAFCSFNAICPADRREHWDAIRGDPRLADYVVLAQPPEEPQS